MPVYRLRLDPDRTREITAPTIADALARAGRHRARLDWPATPAAAAHELDTLADMLTKAGARVERDGCAVDLPDLAAYPGDASGVRIRTSDLAPHALILITAAEVEPLTHAEAVLAHLQPLLEAAAEGCGGCLADPHEPCRPHCTPTEALL